MTQKERLLHYLKINHEIDPLQAWTQLGIYRLSAVVHDLKKDGHNIKTERKQVKNRFGEDCSVGKYVYIHKELKPLVRGDEYLEKVIDIIKGTTEELRSENDKYEQA